jgi:hypothetical protein
MAYLYGYKYSPENGFVQSVFEVEETEKRYKGTMFDRKTVLKSELGEVWCPTANYPTAMVFFAEKNDDKARELLTEHMVDRLCQFQELCSKYASAVRWIQVRPPFN